MRIIDYENMVLILKSFAMTEEEYRDQGSPVTKEAVIRNPKTGHIYGPEELETLIKDE